MLPFRGSWLCCWPRHQLTFVHLFGSDLRVRLICLELHVRSIMDYDPSIRLLTERLALRPTVPDDVERALEIRSNREVARNLVAATLPPDPEKMTNWFSDHAQEWRQGTAFRLAITLEGRLIGICDVFDIKNREGEIGYWLDRAVWGRGFGLEAAERLVRFAIEDVGLKSLRAGCADDNSASAAILTRLGFNRLEDVRVFSRSRQGKIIQRRFHLMV
jgi:[ribosomal protein S5]-alanine N-acetyltransferase